MRIQHKAGGYADPDVIGKTHQRYHSESRNLLGIVVKLDPGRGRQHEQPDHDQRRSVGMSRDRRDKG